jgi:hypothetical protein
MGLGWILILVVIPLIVGCCSEDPSSPVVARG